MNPPIVDRLVRSVDLEGNLLPFLLLSGWKRIEDSNWIVVHGERDIHDRPLELAFPRERTGERAAYISKAVNLLAALRKEPIQLILQSIVNYDRDMLYVRNTETNEGDAILLSLAVDQVSNLRRTIEFSASSERESKPYFPTLPLPARNATRNFLFGHTFSGSFGFTVEAPRLSAPSAAFQAQLLKGEGLPPPPINVPFDRRVVERIARGLMYAKAAEDKRDYQILLREYASGFNSNMCTAVASMSQDKKTNVEFRIVWSPKVPVGDDVSQFKPITLSTGGYEILEYAAKELKAVKPEFVRLVGHVRGLTTTDNPFGVKTKRAIVVRGIYPGSKRPVDVIVELDMEDYAKANDAHISWRNIQVSGIMVRSGTAWRLSNPRDFTSL